MKTQTQTGKTLKALLTAPIGGTQSPVKVPATAGAKVAPKTGSKGAKKSGLYYFDMTPAGRILRAYFLAVIQAQIGKDMPCGKVFKLWPHANIRGHLDTGKVCRKDAGYALTVPGRNYFTDPTQEADKDMLSAMSKAIKSGEKPACYKYAMSQSAK